MYASDPKVFAINGIVAEGTGLEPMPRKDEERVSNPPQYQLCLTLRIIAGMETRLLEKEKNVMVRFSVLPQISIPCHYRIPLKAIQGQRPHKHSAL